MISVRRWHFHQKQFQYIFGKLQFPVCAAGKQRLDTGGISRLIARTVDDIVHRKMHGLRQLHERINGHLGRTHLQLPIVACADVGLFGHLFTGQTQFLPPLPQALANFNQLLLFHDPTPTLFRYCLL